MKLRSRTPVLTPEMFKSKDIPEKEVLNQIKYVLALKKCYCIRFNSGAFKRPNGSYFRAYTLPNGKSDGLPDLEFIRDGKAYFIEVKRKGGKVRESQAEFMNAIRQYGAIAFVADNWGQVLDFLNKLDKKTELSKN